MIISPKRLLTDANKVSFQNVRDYLKARGWSSIPSRRDYASIYRSPGGNEYEVVVPLERTVGDYADSMVRAARDVAEFEGRRTEDVFRDLLRPRRDVLKFGLDGSETSAGTVGFVEGVHLVDGVRKALLASACGVKRARRYHPRLASSEADAYLRGCTLGQTEIGSFVITVDAPLEIAATLSTDNDFGRRSTAHLLRATGTLVQHIKRGDVERLVDVDDSEATVSANLCDALLEIIPPDESADLTLKASWSPMMPSPQDVRSLVEIDRSFYKAIEDVGARLRPTNGPKPARVFAYVAELNGIPSVDEEMEGEVTLSVFYEDELIRAKVELNAEQYAIAADAHMRIAPVVITGLIERGRRLTRVRDVSEFRLTQ